MLWRYSKGKWTEVHMMVYFQSTTKVAPQFLQLGVAYLQSSSAGEREVPGHSNLIFLRIIGARNEMTVIQAKQFVVYDKK